MTMSGLQTGYDDAYKTSNNTTQGLGQSFGSAPVSGWSNTEDIDDVKAFLEENPNFSQDLVDEVISNKIKKLNKTDLDKIVQGLQNRQIQVNVSGLEQIIGSSLSAQQEKAAVDTKEETKPDSPDAVVAHEENTEEEADPIDDLIAPLREKLSSIVGENARLKKENESLQKQVNSIIDILGQK